MVVIRKSSWRVTEPDTIRWYNIIILKRAGLSCTTKVFPRPVYALFIIIPSLVLLPINTGTPNCSQINLIRGKAWFTDKHAVAMFCRLLLECCFSTQVQTTPAVPWLTPFKTREGGPDHLNWLILWLLWINLALDFHHAVALWPLCCPDTCLLKNLLDLDWRGLTDLIQGIHLRREGLACLQS